MVAVVGSSHCTGMCFSWRILVEWCWCVFVCACMRVVYSAATYLRVHTTSFTFMVATICFSSNSRTISQAGSPPCLWINLLPSNVQTLLTVRPSMVSSSNSLPNSNVISVFLNVDDVTNVNLSPSFFNSTVGDTELPILRRTNPTPV